MTQQTIDEAEVQQFAEEMIGHLRGGSIAMLCSIGDQTGLFDALAGEPATSAELADRVALSERYVREWLGGVVSGALVEYQPDTGRYTLPAVHAAVLTSGAGPDNLARLMRMVPLLAEVEQPVLTAFRSGGGVPYTAYPRFHEVMAATSAQTLDAALLDVILPLAEGVPDRLTSGIAVADLGCGQGHAINLMARAYPSSEFIGYDFEAGAIEAARAEAEAWGLGNATFRVQDVADLDVESGFDLVTAFDAIHDQARPAAVLDRARRALRADGTFLMVDIKADSRLEGNLANPFAPFFYTVSLMHCMTVSLSQGGDGLGTVWGRQRALGMLDDAGFGEVRVHEVNDDPINNYYVARATA